MFYELTIPDYILIWVSIFFVILFFFTGIENIYKAYLGAILWLSMFSIINIIAGWFGWWSDTGLQNFIFENRESLWFYSIFLIPLLAIIIPFNENVWFRVSQKKGLNILVTFLFGIFFFSFLLTIFISISQNRFLFTLNEIILEDINQSIFMTSLFTFFDESKIFAFLIQYNNIINLIIIIFIFYKMTIWGIIDYIFAKIFQALGRIFEKRSHQDSHDAHGEH